MKPRDREYILETAKAWGNTYPRDSQRQKMYNAERRAQGRIAEIFADKYAINSVEEAETLLVKILKSHWWKVNITPFSVRTFNGNVSVINNSRRRGACAMYSRVNGPVCIHLSKAWTWNIVVLLHELAHYPSSGRGIPDHGWLFCNVLLGLVKRFIGKEAKNILAEEFDKGGVRWRRERQISDETRKELSDRMTALAAEQWDGHEKVDKLTLDYVKLTSNQDYLVGKFISSIKVDLPDWDIDYTHDREAKTIEVTKMAINHVAKIASNARWNYQPDYLSALGLLKKLKVHSPGAYGKVVNANLEMFRELPHEMRVW